VAIARLPWRLLVCRGGCSLACSFAVAAPHVHGGCVCACVCSGWEFQHTCYNVDDAATCIDPAVSGYVPPADYTVPASPGSFTGATTFALGTNNCSEMATSLAPSVTSCTGFRDLLCHDPCAQASPGSPSCDTPTERSLTHMHAVARRCTVVGVSHGGLCVTRVLESRAIPERSPGAAAARPSWLLSPADLAARRRAVRRRGTAAAARAAGQPPLVAQPTQAKAAPTRTRTRTATGVSSSTAHAQAVRPAVRTLLLPSILSSRACTQHTRAMHVTWHARRVHARI
jgi:hypothetical protein